MDDPDFSVSLVKLDSVNQEEAGDSDMAGYSSFVSRAKESQLLWESLREQGQLFKVLDTLTAKTAQLIGKVQNQTASDDESATVAGLLSQLGILLVDTETKQDGTKEKRYTFVTGGDSAVLQQSANAHERTAQPEEIASAGPVTLTSAREVETTSDDDLVIDPGAESDEPPPAVNICEWCKKDQGTVVSLDLHKVQSCEVLMRYRPHTQSMPCPTCGQNFRQLARLQNHLLVDHEMEAAKVMKFLHEVKNFSQEGLDEAGDDSESSEAESKIEEMAPKGHMVCDVCRDTFWTRIALRTHLMDAHNFSRQRAVSSVYESVKLAQSQVGSRPGPDEPKKGKKYVQGYSFHCVECEARFGNRGDLVDHLMLLHSLTRSRAQKEANKQYKEMNSTFECDLCPSKYSDRYVLSKHFIRVHKLSKKQAHSKSRKMYPSERKKHKAAKADATPFQALSGKSKSRDVDEGVEEGSSANPRRLRRSTVSTRSERNTLERASKRLAQSEKGEEVSPENDGDEQGGLDDSREANEENNQDKESNVSDRDAAEHSESDEEYVPSELDEENEENNPGVKCSAKSRWKRSKLASGPKLDVGSHDKGREEEGEDIPNDEISVPVESDGEMKTSNSQTPEKPKKRRGRKPGQTSNVKGGHKCPHCDKTFRNLKYVKVHIAGYHKENPAYQCGTCKKTFYVRNTFVRHLNCHKNEEMGVRFTCDVCGKCFFDKYSLGTHNKIHWSEKPFKCEFCDRSFFHQSLLTRHRNMHTKETEYKCSYCEKVFYRKGGLKYHVLAIHENKRDHVCSDCGQGFASKSVLLAHSHTHSTHRAFQCDICGTRVKTKGNLKEHMMCVHTDKRDFKCDICDKTFNRSHRLTLHMMMHRNERPHKCHLCDKAFRTRTNLTVHIKWHQDQRDFQCEQCGKTFLIPGNLDRHMQTHRHGKKTKRKSTKKAPAQGIHLANPEQAQLPVHVEAEASPMVDGQFQTVQNLVEGGGFESDLPTLASIAHHLSSMNIPVFQVPPASTSTQGPTCTSIPVTINPAESTCTPLPGSITCMSREASIALAVFTQAQQQMQDQSAVAPAMSVQGNFEQIELTM